MPDAWITYSRNNNNNNNRSPSNQTTMCSIKYTKPIEKKKKKKIEKMDATRTAAAMTIFLFLFWGATQKICLLHFPSLSFRLSWLWLKIVRGAKLLIKLNCLPCVFASPDAPTMANSKDNRRWEQQEDFGFPKRKILQPQQQFSWLATANYDGIFTFGLVKCAANLVYEIL